MPKNEQEKTTNLREESVNQEITYPLSSMILLGVLGVGLYIGVKECLTFSNSCSDHSDS